MASSDVDQKFLGKWAKLTADSNALLSSSLYQLLGLSVRLARKVVKARRHRKLDTSRDTKSMSLYHHIIWLSREGLSIVEIFVLPYTQEGQHGPECQVLAAKLRASFFHIFCLFHNKPPVSQLSLAGGISSPIPSVPPIPQSQQQQQSSPRGNNGQSRKAANSASNSPNTGRTRPGATLRDPINSITSETSFLTNPFASGGPVLTPPPPPGLPMPVSTPHASAFLLPPLNFIPPTTAHFNTVSTLAQTLLPGSHPLRLSVALEHCAFLWDCLHERESSRKTARAAIRDVYRSQEGMDDREFEEAAELVAVLGKMMKRKSWEGTPKVGGTVVSSPVKETGGGNGHANGNGNGAAVQPSAPSHTRSSSRYSRDVYGNPIEQSRIPEGSPTGGRERRRNSRGEEPQRRVRAQPTQPQPSEMSSRSARGGTSRHGGSSAETTPRAAPSRQGSSSEITPRAGVTANRFSGVSVGSSTPRAPQQGSAPVTPRSTQQHGRSSGTPQSSSRQQQRERTPTTPTSPRRTRGGRG